MYYRTASQICAVDFAQALSFLIANANHTWHYGGHNHYIAASTGRLQNHRRAK
jgi:hypothetical protein